MEICVHDPFVSQAAFFLLLNDLSTKSTTSLPREGTDAYSTESNTEMYIQLAHARHKNVQGSAHEMILNYTGLKFNTSNSIPVESLHGTVGNSQLHVLNAIDVNLCLKHVVLAQALALRFASMRKAVDQKATSDMDNGCYANGVMASKGDVGPWPTSPAQQVIDRKYSRNISRMVRTVILSPISLSLWDDLSFDVDEEDFLEGDEEEVEKKEIFKLSLICNALAETIDTHSAKLEFQFLVQVRVSASVHTSYTKFKIGKQVCPISCVSAHKYSFLILVFL